ncbi:MAG: hypothetical protein A2Z73_03085 [Deltaproteobacteria bacterium RBG_13_60_28]|nr:MAG: hypothetical protein A2Z73_03085 [Deltaproteobacteria bacterium RBG_13_60_28]
MLNYGLIRLMESGQVTNRYKGVATMTARSKHGTSRIVPFLPEGCAVDVPAQLANYVCTDSRAVKARPSQMLTDQWRWHKNCKSNFLIHPRIRSYFKTSIAHKFVILSEAKNLVISRNRPFACGSG